MDNYADFLQRLDAAAASLEERREVLDSARKVVAAALEDNESGYRQWSDRLSTVETILISKTATDKNGLQELRGVATKMQSMFRTRSERIGARLASVDSRIAELDGPLHELNLGKVRLTTSRRVAEEREKLGLAMQNLAGTTEGVDGVVPDEGLLQDLKKAREAVVLAEALLEVKEG
ncbi:hypothetical protein BN1051_00223 [Arthrobacter saudimassiliensis]|uniref:Chromosome partition protein Smc n=1 Tax=Arthrobacter saudimassiliensis TaxID=1461584 RepID=A0A078MKZ2_9MICC|nr:hypothetical protein BN1051_00223 [Arthrobacter saudimassiliensis]